MMFLMVCLPATPSYHIISGGICSFIQRQNELNCIEGKRVSEMDGNDACTKWERLCATQRMLFVVITEWPARRRTLSSVVMHMDWMCVCVCSRINTLRSYSIIMCIQHAVCVSSRPGHSTFKCRSGSHPSSMYLLLICSGSTRRRRQRYWPS